MEEQPRKEQPVNQEKQIKMVTSAEIKNQPKTTEQQMQQQKKQKNSNNMLL